MPDDKNGLSTKGFKRMSYTNNLGNSALPQRKSKLKAVVIIVALISVINVAVTAYNYLLLQQQQKNLSGLKDDNTQLQTKITEMVAVKSQTDKQFNLLAKETKDINDLHKQNQDALKKQQNIITEHKKTTAKIDKDIRQKIKQLETKVQQSTSKHTEAEKTVNKIISSIKDDLSNIKANDIKRNNIQIDTILDKTNELEDLFIDMKLNVKNKLNQIENSLRDLNHRAN